MTKHIEMQYRLKTAIQAAILHEGKIDGSNDVEQQEPRRQQDAEQRKRPRQPEEEHVQPQEQPLRRQERERPRADGQGQLRRSRTAGQLRRRHGRVDPGEAGRRQGPVHEEGLHLIHDGARREARHRRY